MALAGYAPRTRRYYLWAAPKFVKRFMRPPEQMGQEELRTHVAELAQSGIGASHLKVQLAALKFLYAKTLGRPQEVAWMSWPTPPRGMPRVLGFSETVALIGALKTPLYRAVALVLCGPPVRRAGQAHPARRLARAHAELRGRAGRAPTPITGSRGHRSRLR